MIDSTTVRSRRGGKIVLLFAAGFTVLGVLEAMFAALGEVPYWQRVGIYFRQIGLGWPLIGAGIGYIYLFRRRNREKQRSDSINGSDH